MKLIIPPDHVVVEPGRFVALLSSALEHGVRQTTVITDRSYPHGPAASAPSHTEHPFLMIPLAGTMDISHVERGRLTLHTIQPYNALIHAGGTWVCCDHSRTRTHIRVTIGEQEILFGVREKRERRVEGAAPAGALELFPCEVPISGATRSLLDMLWSSGSSYAQVQRSHLFALLLIELIRVLKTDRSEGRGKSYATWVSLCDYLSAHCHRSLARDDAAAALGVTPRHITRLCAAHSGTGFHERLEGLRLARAKTLLTGSRMSVKEIAFACGFASAGYFGRVFARREGTTPGRWRLASPDYA
jgi:AraC-like DNA-binding protein